MTHKLTSFRPQRRNANRHTPRGLGALEKSIQKDGVIGAITVAADGEVFDGSARIEVLAGVGLEDAIVVHSNGDKPIIHVRDDIPTADDPRAKRLGVAANRIAQIDLDYDRDVLAELRAEPDVLDGLFRDDELDDLLRERDIPIPDPEYQQEPELRSECFVEIYCGRADLAVMRAALAEWGERDGVIVSIIE